MMDRRNDYDYNDEQEEQSPSPNIANNANLRTHEDNLFHLQQELLRQELPKNQWREIRQNQSQRLEQFLAREEQMWAQRSNSRGGNKRRQDSFNEGSGDADARRQRMSEPESDGFTSHSMDNNVNITMDTGSMGRGQRVGGSFSFGTNDQYNYNNHFLGSSHLNMTNTMPSNGMNRSDAENLNGMNADSYCFDVMSNNMMSNTTSRNNNSMSRSPVDNPFGFNAMQQQQQQNSNWHNSNNNNQSNNMNSSNDRSRSMGSSPAPFMREMGISSYGSYRNSSRDVTEDPNSFGVKQQPNFNGQGSSQVQQFSFQQQYGQADHQQGGSNNASHNTPPPNSPMGGFVNVTRGSPYGTVDTSGTRQNPGGIARSSLGADNFFGGKTSSSSYNVDNCIQQQQYYGQQASPSPRPARALSPYTLRLQQSMMSQHQKQQQGSMTNHAASSASASSSNNLECMPPQERDPTPIRDLTHTDSFKKHRASGPSSQMILQMLSDTVMMSPNPTPVNAKQVLTLSQPQQHQSFPHLPSACTTSSTQSPGEGNANNIGKVASAMRDSDLLPMSSFSTYTKPTVLNNEEQVSPTPLDHTKAGVDQIGGDTPTLFSSYFLANNIGAGQDNGLDVNTMPPPPLVQAKPSPKPSATTKTPEGTMPPPAVPVKKKTVHKQQPQQGSSASSQGGKKKPKTKKSKDKPPKKEKTPADTSNHIITPSSAIISGIAAEIRSQMASSAQEQPTRTSARATEGETTSGNGTASAASSSGENSTKGPNGLSIPQFASAMEATQASQQAIHDWDRKFGLRRAHSKTMRESCRSRKRVLEFLKGEGASLMLLNKTATSSMNEDAAAEVAATVAVKALASTTSKSSITQEGEGAYAQQCDEKVEASEAVEGMGEFMKKLGNGDTVEQTTLSSVEELEGEQMSSRKLPTSLGSLYLQIDTSSAKLTINPSPTTSKQPGNESKVDDHLERMFRRTSIECVAPILPFVPPPKEADRKQYHARGA